MFKKKKIINLASAIHTNVLLFGFVCVLFLSGIKILLPTSEPITQLV